ncbi:MAG TPA: signal recognition particle-docking protein FtsY [Arenicellales bacterium]|jgi:fused signal recognition particle receptor|nr:signal recognition particle-docking protein FtsY [Arenicellales bacterium]HJL65938.1 signal recognition particle-docking protein FtsY [Arenicellales bacterium]|tara:strand:+ start:1190 stop:2119 length:930 start_codon:yes stop_codon:yes gene_type:complete
MTNNQSDKHGLFARLRRSRESIAQGVVELFNSSAEFDEVFFEDLEDCLIMADVGVEASSDLVQRLRLAVREGGVTEGAAVMSLVQQKAAEMLEDIGRPWTPPAVKEPWVIMLVGVNGVGKTTTIAKLAYHLNSEGRSVMLAAADTYRAAAIEQLQVWGERLKVPVVASSRGSDAAAVAHDALTAAQARQMDVLLVDTAGRQHTDSGLMDQLTKVSRVLTKCQAGTPHEILMVVDATNGQNVLSQIDHFHQRLGLSGLILTKLDGSAKGGVLLSASKRFQLPVRFVGLGEGESDLKKFNPLDFSKSLFSL